MNAKGPHMAGPSRQNNTPSIAPSLFDGASVGDAPRLSRQQSRIARFMADGRWHSLEEIARATGAPAASVSAQLRHLRKPKFGAAQVDKRYEGRGLYRYRVTWPDARGFMVATAVRR